MGRHRAADRAQISTVSSPAESASSTLAHRVGQGVAWSALNAAALRFGQFFMTVVVARLVAPNQFGVFVVALTVYTIVVNVSEIGVSSAIIREVENTPAIAPTVASIAIGTSAGLAVLMFLTAHPLASALGADSATNAVRVLALCVVIGGAGAVPSAVLIRDYQQKRMFVVDANVFVVSNAVLIALAFMGWGVMALVWSRVVGQVISTILFNALSSERYRPGFDRREARRLLRFGLPLAAANLLGFTVGNVDFMVVGRVRGARALGLYNLAFNISAWPVTIFTNILSNVTLTTLSRARDSQAELQAHLAGAMSCLAALSFPVSAMSAALAVPLIDTVYGDRWSGAAGALVALAVFGAVRVVISLLSDLLVALGCTKRLLLLQVIWLGTLIPVMVWLVTVDGFVGAGVAQSVVAIVVVVPAYLLAIRGRIDIGFGWLWRSILPPLGASIISGVVALAVANQVDQPFIGLACGGLAGSLVYLLVLGSWLRSLAVRMRALYRRPRIAQLHHVEAGHERPPVTRHLAKSGRG